MSGFIGGQSGSTGAVDVSGDGSTWSSSSGIFVGDSGTGTLTIGDGGTVSLGASAAIAIGESQGGNGTLTLTDDGSALNLNGAPMHVGDAGTGVFNIEHGADLGGQLKATTIAIGGNTTAAGGTGSLEVGDESALVVSGNLTIWNQGSSLTISDSSNTTIGGSASNNGTITLTDSTLTISGVMTGTGSVNIGDNSTIEFGGTVAQSGMITFSGSSATLKFDVQTNFANAKISGVQDGDTIDLTFLPFDTSYKPVWQGSTLSVVDEQSGATKAVLTLAGTYSSQEFTLSSDSHGGTLISNNEVTGTASDGYLSGATVFADADGNGQLDPGEPSATTNASGGFTLAAGSAPLVIFGGTDTSTGLAFTGELQAPAGAGVVTPLTALLTVLEDTGQSGLQAEAETRSGLGLAPTVSLLKLDPIAGATAGNQSSFAVVTDDAQVIDTGDMISAALAGVGGSAAEVFHDAFAALAAALAALVQGQTLDLTNQATISALINGVATSDGITVSNIVTGISTIIAASNAALAHALQLTIRALRCWRIPTLSSW